MSVSKRVRFFVCLCLGFAALLAQPETVRAEPIKSSSSVLVGQVGGLVSRTVRSQRLKRKREERIILAVMLIAALGLFFSFFIRSDSSEQR